MSKFPKLNKMVLALSLLCPVMTFSGCGGSGGEAEIQTYEPVTEEEKEIAVEKMERLQDEPRG